MRAAGKPTLPTTIGSSWRRTRFLRPQSRRSGKRLGMEGSEDWQVFAGSGSAENRASCPATRIRIGTTMVLRQARLRRLPSLRPGAFLEPSRDGDLSG